MKPTRLLHRSSAAAAAGIVAALVLPICSLLAQDLCGVVDPEPPGFFAALPDPCPTATPGSTPYAPDTAWSTGPKSLICIRVNFSDAVLGGSPAGDLNDLNATATHYQAYSRGRTTINPTVTNNFALRYDRAHYQALVDQDPCTTKPQVKQALYDDAVNAAGITPGYYDRIMVHFPALQNWNNGTADVKGKRIWMNGDFDWRLAAHELGHTYGCGHAGRWAVPDSNPVNPNGTVDIYGDQFDVMGRNWDKGPENDFNEDYKVQLGWIVNTRVKTLTQPGTYRDIKIYRFDSPDSLANGKSGWFAIKFVKDATYDYWIGYRRNFTRNYTLSNGAYVVWVEKTKVHSLLIDWVPSTDYSDAAVPKNSTLRDGGISITPTGNGQDLNGDQWLTVTVVIP